MKKQHEQTEDTKDVLNKNIIFEHSVGETNSRSTSKFERVRRYGYLQYTYNVLPPFHHAIQRVVCEIHARLFSLHAKDEQLATALSYPELVTDDYFATLCTMLAFHGRAYSNTST